MLDTIIANGQVVTPQGAGAWEIGIKGEQIVAVGLPGSLPRDGARVIDAAGKIVVPGGIDPHTHLAHAIMSHPDQPSATLGPEDDTRGMAYGGTTTHIDFVYVRPDVDNIQTAIEQRAARWKGNSHVDYAYHITLCGALDLKVFEQIPEVIRAGYPSFKVFTTNVLPPHPKRQGNRLDFGRIGFAMEKVAPAGGLMVVHGEDEDLVQFNYERFRHEGRMDGTNLHLVHTELSELLAFRRTVTLARAMSAAVYFVHTSAKEGVETIGEARADGNVGAEARMGIGYSEGVVKRGMTLERFADITATNAARIFGLYPKKGTITAGSDADLVLIDPSLRKTLVKDDFHVTDYSPWEGWSVTGWPVFTMLRGKVIVDHGTLVGTASDGRQLTRKIDPVMLRRPAC